MAGGGNIDIIKAGTAQGNITYSQPGELADDFCVTIIINKNTDSIEPCGIFGCVLIEFKIIKS